MNPEACSQGGYRPDRRRLLARALRHAFVALTVLGCSSRKFVGATSHQVSLGVDGVAAVGRRILTRTQLGAVNRGSESNSAFTDRWIRDALVAEAARAGLLRPWRLNQTERSVLARALLEEIYSAAIAAGPPTDAEIASLTAERWVSVDRPAAAQVTHFVVLVHNSDSDGRARQLARSIALATRGLSDPTAFIHAAKSVPSAGLDVVAESLPPMTAEGRGLKLDSDGNPVGQGPTFDATFARAANELEGVGTHSGLVRTPFGYHVLLLLRKYPAYQMPLDERRRAFASDIVTRRARQESDRCIERGKTRLPVSVESAFQEVLEKSQVLP